MEKDGKAGTTLDILLKWLTVIEYQRKSSELASDQTPDGCSSSQLSFIHYSLVYLNQHPVTDLWQLLCSSCLFTILALGWAQGFLSFFWGRTIFLFPGISVVLELLNCSVHPHCCLFNGSIWSTASKSTLIFGVLHLICSLEAFPRGNLYIRGQC